MVPATEVSFDRDVVVRSLTNEKLLELHEALRADHAAAVNGGAAQALAAIDEYVTLTQTELERRGLTAQVARIPNRPAGLVQLGRGKREEPRPHPTTCLACNVPFQEGDRLSRVEGKDDDGNPTEYVCHELCFWQERAKGYEQAHAQSQRILAMTHRLLCGIVNRAGGTVTARGKDFEAAEKGKFELDIQDVPDGGVKVRAKWRTLVLATTADLKDLKNGG
jgi:hypothetical protein